jgi:hydrogenase expression/formation protein HypC
VEWRDQGESAFAQALVEFAGVRRPVNMACVPDAELGEYVLVHAGVAITRIDSREAARILADLSEMESLLAGDEKPGDPG